MGDFDNYTLDELREMVDPDRPDELGSQAESWNACAELLTAQLETLRARLSDARSSWSGAAAEVFFTEMDKRCGELDEAAGVASDNARVWGRIRDHADNARTGIFAIYEEWRGGGGTSDARDDPRRKPFDDRARKLMGMVAEETDHDYRQLRYQRPFTPFGGSGSDSGGGTSGGPGTGGSDTGTGGTSPVSASRAPGSTSVGANPAPELQGIAPTTPAIPTPAPTPATPAPTVPLPPPVPGLPPSPMPRTGPPPRAATPPMTPRPPQRTVPSVIGSRPGTTGMAPTARGNTPSQIARPVIGARPAATTGKAAPPPSRPLIGGNGVVKGPASGKRQPTRVTRAPKANFGDRSPNRGVIRGSAPTNPAKAIMDGENIRTEIRRLSRRDEPGHDGDHTEPFWRPSGTVVPGVVTGTPADDGPHDPGPVWGRDGTDTAPEDEKHDPGPIWGRHRTSDDRPAPQNP